jgi:murein DD-endopeptidase MepM/ murein hydrolase activator NlpD
MNRWKGSTSGALVWGFFLLVGGMILYTGYLGTLYFSSQERTPMITNETDQAVSARTAHDPEAGGTALIMQSQTGEMTADDQASVSNSSKIYQEIQGEQNLKDFPCPAHGSPLRSVGNYYSEAFDNYLFHGGMDYAEPEGTMIRATHGGKVIFSGADPILGQKVTLDCGGGWLVTYGGLDNLRVQVGETVETQDALGQVGFFPGAEGGNEQPQLHYEVWHGDEVQRP